MTENDVSKEWAKLFLTQLERHEKSLSDRSKECHQCREDLIDRISEIRAKQRELVVKITFGAVILGLLADFGIRFLMK